MRTIAVLNQKGGVGKTTTTANTAAALAAMGQRVIVIDLDPQAHLTIHLGVEPQAVLPGSYEVLMQSAGFEESLMMVRANLWLLGANINLVGAETELVSVVGREIILREAMQASQDRFDFCLIDCAPSLGLLSLNALAASQEVLIPLQPHFLALQGFGKLLQTVDLVNKRINPSLKVSGVLLCMFDTRASLPNEVRADIARFLDNARGSGTAWADARLVPTFIRRNIKLAEAPSYGQTVFEYDPACNGAEDYKGVAEFFLGIEPEARFEVELELETELESEPESAIEEVVAVEDGPVNWQPEPEAVVTPEEMHGPATNAGEPFPLQAESAPASEVEAIVESELESLAAPGAGHETEPQFSDEPPESMEAERHRLERQIEPESGSEPSSESQGHDEPEARDDPSDATPIEIREFQSPGARRYCPPPLKSYPIPPYRRSQEPDREDETEGESSPPSEPNTP